MKMLNNSTSRAKKIGAAVLGAVALVLAGSAASTHAALILDYNNNSVIVVDNGAGDTDPTVGRIVNTTNVAGFGVSINIAQSNSPGAATGGILQIDSLDVVNTNATASNLAVRVSDTNFTAPGVPNGPMQLQSAVGGTFTQAAI